MIPFQYRRIDRSLIQQLTDCVLAGESVVLLGPRYVGKRYLMSQLHTRLSEAEVTPLIPISFFQEGAPALERSPAELVSEAVAEVDESWVPTGSPTDDRFASLDWLAERTRRPVVLLAANVDGMPHHLARRFLEGIRSRVEAQRLVVILSGEDTFQDLVHGPKSEFNCANQFVIQGFAGDEFCSVVSRYCGALNIQLESPVEVYRQLEVLSGGNIHLARMVLGAAIETTGRGESTDEASFSLEDIARIDSLWAKRPASFPESRVFQYATQLIARDPGCLDDVDNLIQGRPVPLGLLQGPPALLELAGVAVREREQLRFASPIMAQFVRRYYDHRRCGDLYARNGLWQKAFAQYALLTPEQRVRPAHVDDRTEAATTVAALCAALHPSANRGREDVIRLFADGCRYILGFRELTFWEGEEVWRPRDAQESGLDEATLLRLASALPTASIEAPGTIPLPEPWSRYACAALLPSLRPNQRGAVVISDITAERTISREQERLAGELLTHFVEAYSHAVAVERNRLRLSVREQHVGIMNAIFEALGSRVLDPRNVLAMAARGLRDLGYRRVLFCLVDPRGEQIKGVLDSSDDPGVDVARMTDWPLGDPMADLQPYVVCTKQSRIVPDASADPLTNKEVVREARLRALGIVPVLSQANMAIGTIHVERADGAVPTRQEIEDLEAFGRQLAIAVEQSEQVNLLQSALDKIAEPIAIVDLKGHLRYANEAAAGLFGVHGGWHKRSEAQRLPNAETDGTLQLVSESLNSKRRLLSHITGVGNRPDYRATVTADSIQDWLGNTVGSVLHIQNLTYLHKLFESLRLIAGVSDLQTLMRCILEVTQLLGHRWQRLWMVDKTKPDELVSRAGMGFTDPSIEEQFNSGRVRLSANSTPQTHAWRCIEQVAPLVFCWKEELSHGAEFMTRSGLRVHNLNPPLTPPEVEEKKPGDFWIDLPLMAHSAVIGKLTLQCSEDLAPDEYDILSALAALVSGLLDTFMQRERDGELWTRQAAQKTMALIAHNLATRLAALPVLLARYVRREGEYPRLNDLNMDFAGIIDETLNTIRRTKDLLVPVVPHLRELDITVELEQACHSTFSEGSWQLQCQERPLMMMADGHLLRNAFLELAQNTKDISDRPDALRVELTVGSVSRDGHGWVRVEYVDNGPGIPDHLKAKIFDDFFSFRPGGKTSTGLGLGLVHRVIVAHGGSIREEGTFGQGAKFVIEIPRASH